MIERKGRKVADVPHPWLDAVLGVGMPGVLSMADPGYVCTAAEPLPIPSWDDLAAERATDRDRARRDRARLVATGVCYSCRREPATNGGICRPCLAVVLLGRPLGRPHRRGLEEVRRLVRHLLGRPHRRRVRQSLCGLHRRGVRQSLLQLQELIELRRIHSAAVNLPPHRQTVGPALPRAPRPGLGPTDRGLRAHALRLRTVRLLPRDRARLGARGVDQSVS